MPRIRTLKPEHKGHRKVGPYSDRQYRLWVGMVTEADDDGRLVADAKWLRAVVFPYHDKLSVGRVEEALQAIAKSGAIVLYSHGDTRYAWFPSWRDHQKLDRAHYTPSRLPPPPRESLGSLPRVSEESTQSLPGGPSATRGSQGSEGKGREPNYSGKGGESEGRETTDGSHDPDSTQEADEIRRATTPTALAALTRPGDELLARALNISPAEVARRRATAAENAPAVSSPRLAR